MPNVIVHLPDVYESVVRRSAKKVVSDLSNIMRLAPDVNILLPGAAQTVPMNGGNFDNCCTTGVKYHPEERIIVTVSEDVDENYTLTTSVKNRENFPIFEDESIMLEVSPVFRYLTLTLNFEYRAPSRVVVERWINEMRSRISAGRQDIQHILEYHYGIPRPLEALLKDIHKTKEDSNWPDGDSFDEFLKRITKTPITTLTDLKGGNGMYAVPEHQYEVMGWFDFTTSPPTPDPSEAGTFVTNFSYMVHFSKPVQLNVRYPLVVHNKIIPKTWWPAGYPTPHQEIAKRVSTTKNAFEGLMYSLSKKPVPYVHHPEFDDFYPKDRPIDTNTFFSGILTLNPQCPNFIINLYRLGNFTFTPYFLEYFYLEGTKAISENGGPFSFRLYENGRYMGADVLELEPNSLNVISRVELNPKRVYHIQIGLKKNWYRISNEGIETLRKYPVVTYICLRVLGIALANRAYLDLDVIGAGRPLDDKGQGRIINSPDDGGVWPWPWLEEKWGEIGWPGVDWCGTGWPGGGWNVCFQKKWFDIPTWPHDKAPTLKNPEIGGMIKTPDMIQAIDRTDKTTGDYIDFKDGGPFTVMYSQVISLRRT